MKITLEAARVNAGLTQKDVADKIGVSANTLRKWEKGASYPDVGEVFKLCKIYNAAFEDIVFEAPKT